MPNINHTSLLGLFYMTFSDQSFKSCINTATAFFNKFDTCSSCEDLEKNLAR